jgi:hypothetical protein
MPDFDRTKMLAALTEKINYLALPASTTDK